LTLSPWTDWAVDKSPDWWSKGYNKIKHKRNKHFKEANLFNALSSVSGLLCGIVYYYKEVTGDSPVIKFYQAPKLLESNSYDIYVDGQILWKLPTPD
jgi:hypothetical protein